MSGVENPAGSFSSAQLMLLLVPGFLASAIRYRYQPASKRSDLERLAESLLASLVIYAAASLVLTRAFPDAEVTLPCQIVALLATAVIFGVVWSRLLTWDRLHRMGAKLAGSRRTPGVSVWVDTFRKNQRIWVRAYMKSGRVYCGSPDLNSDEPDQYQLFLAQAERFDPDGKRCDVEGPGVFLNINDAESIEFLSGRKKAKAPTRPTLRQAFAGVVDAFVLFIDILLSELKGKIQRFRSTRRNKKGLIRHQ